MQTEALQLFTQALAERAWYPAAASLFTLLIMVLRHWQPRLFEGEMGKPPIVPKRWQWTVALGTVGMTAFVEAFSRGLGVDMAIGLTVFAMLTGGTSAVGVHRIGKELLSNKPKLPPSAGGVLLLVCALGLGGCAAVKPIVRTVDDLAREACNLYFSEQMGVELPAEE